MRVGNRQVSSFYHGMMELNLGHCFIQGDYILGNETDKFWSVQTGTVFEKQWGGAVPYIWPYTVGNVFIRLYGIQILSFIGFIYFPYFSLVHYNYI